ncbi:hypothetical protein E6O75_ATG04772 [Venturia nashicola]|uniref:Uncharacterized protein n=1 Tax=Venturia nashicola TaxID=86259 RepID=A0A4Z1PGU9_9PEZI|nr:hypothetical protein E6O75_ATG04772 [Venturia nashicola]
MKPTSQSVHQSSVPINFGKFISGNDGVEKPLQHSPEKSRVSPACKILRSEVNKRYNSTTDKASETIRVGVEVRAVQALDPTIAIVSIPSQTPSLIWRTGYDRIKTAEEIKYKGPQLPKEKERTTPCNQVFHDSVRREYSSNMDDSICIASFDRILKSRQTKHDEAIETVLRLLLLLDFKHEQEICTHIPLSSVTPQTGKFKFSKPRYPLVTSGINTSPGWSEPESRCPSMLITKSAILPLGRCLDFKTLAVLLDGNRDRLTTFHGATDDSIGKAISDFLSDEPVEWPSTKAWIIATFA